MILFANLVRSITVWVTLTLSITFFRVVTPLSALLAYVLCDSPYVSALYDGVAKLMVIYFDLGDQMFPSFASLKAFPLRIGRPVGCERTSEWFMSRCPYLNV